MKAKWLLALASGFVLQGSEAREFTDVQGRKIQGELVGFVDDSVKIRIGSKVSTVKTTLFSDADQAFIKNWIAKNPTKAAYRFRYYVDLDENFKGRVRTDGAAYDDKLKFRPHNYKLIVYNANDIEVKGLTIRWEVYLNDVVDTVGNAYTKLAVGYKKQDKLQTLAGKLVDKSLDLKGKIEINHGFILQDYVDRDGGRVDQAARDNVIGIRARIYKDDELIDEFEDGEDDGRFKDASWQDAESEAPIEDSSE